MVCKTGCRCAADAGDGDRHINASIQLEALTTHGKDFGVSVPQKVLETVNATVAVRKNESSRMSTAKEDKEYDEAFDKAIEDLPF